MSDNDEIKREDFDIITKNTDSFFYNLRVWEKNINFLEEDTYDLSDKICFTSYKDIESRIDISKIEKEKINLIKKLYKNIYRWDLELVIWIKKEWNSFSNFNNIKNNYLDNKICFKEEDINK